MQRQRLSSRWWTYKVVANIHGQITSLPANCRKRTAIANHHLESQVMKFALQK